MKLTKDQAYELFKPIERELNTQKNVKVRHIKNGNKKLEIEVFEKFKKSPEYAAITLLMNSYPKSEFTRIYKTELQHMSNKLFKIKYQSDYISVYNEIPNILLLALDCDNTKQLKEVINKKYNLKNKLK